MHIPKVWTIKNTSNPETYPHLIFSGNLKISGTWNCVYVAEMNHVYIVVSYQMFFRKPKNSKYSGLLSILSEESSPCSISPKLPRKFKHLKNLSFFLRCIKKLHPCVMKHHMCCCDFINFINKSSVSTRMFK